MTLPGNEDGNGKKDGENGMSATSGPLDLEAEMAGYDAKKIGDIGGGGGKGLEG